MKIAAFCEDAAIVSEVESIVRLDNYVFTKTLFTSIFSVKINRKYCNYIGTKANTKK